METSTLIHSKSNLVERSALVGIPTPESTATWFPVSHTKVIDTVGDALNAAGFVIRKEQHAVTNSGNRLFSTMDLEASLAGGVALSVGIRNSLDKSLPLGFCAGSRVFVCDNLAFRSELLVVRKHTRFGNERFNEAIALAVKSLAQFKTEEAARIESMKAVELKPATADSVLLRSFEEGLVNTHQLPEVIAEWRKPSFEEFMPRTQWSLFNCFTTVLGRRNINPQRYAAVTLQLGTLLTGSQDAAAPEIVQAI